MKKCSDSAPIGEADVMQISPRPEKNEGFNKRSQRRIFPTTKKAFLEAMVVEYIGTLKIKRTSRRVVFCPKEPLEIM